MANATFLFYLITGLQIAVGLGWIWLFIYIKRREKRFMAMVVRSMHSTPTSTSPMDRLMAALAHGDEKELDYQEAIEEAERIIAESRRRDS